MVGDESCDVGAEDTTPPAEVGSEGMRVVDAGEITVGDPVDREQNEEHPELENDEDLRESS